MAALAHGNRSRMVVAQSLRRVLVPEVHLHPEPRCCNGTQLHLHPHSVKHPQRRQHATKHRNQHQCTLQDGYHLHHNRYPQDHRHLPRQCCRRGIRHLCRRGVPSHQDHRNKPASTCKVNAVEAVHVFHRLLLACPCTLVVVPVFQAHRASVQIFLAAMLVVVAHVCQQEPAIEHRGSTAPLHCLRVLVKTEC